jgi:hypothetical protein
MKRISQALALLAGGLIVVAAILWGASQWRGDAAIHQGTPLVSSVATPEDQNADSCKVCMDACTEQRENCRIAACRQVGGAPQGSQACDNISTADAKSRYGVLIQACFDSARACEMACKTSGSCK